MLKILLFNISSLIRDALVLYLIPKGIMVYFASDEKEAEEKINTHNISNVLFDADSKDIDYKTFFESLKSKKSGYNCKLILYTMISNKDQLNSYRELGLIGVIPKKASIPDMTKSITTYIDKYLPEGKSRKPIRIKPPDEDEVKLGLKIQTEAVQKQAISKINDLSSQMVVFEFEVPSESYHFSEGQEFETVDLIFGKRHIFTPGKIVKLKSPIGIVSFHKVKENFLKAVCLYLMDKYNSSPELSKSLDE